MPTTISEEQDVFTTINVFTVEPEDQQRLVDLLVEATEETMRHLPGGVAANIHKSLDGTRVVNYAQWETREAFEAMLENEEAQQHIEQARTIVTEFEAIPSEVVFVHQD